MKQESGDASKCEALNSEKWELDYEWGDDVGGITVWIMGCFPDEDEPFLDECWDSIVGGKENKTNCEDVEIEKPVNVLERWMAQVLEKVGQNEGYNS